MTNNFYLPADATIDYFPQTKKEKAAANLEAVRILKELGDKPASREQQEAMSKYVGWGGLANDFFDTATPSFAKEREELHRLTTEDEYNAMRASSLTAYYTDPGICRAMWAKVVRDGVTKGNILDPSMGTGMFFMTMPEELRETTELWGVELDTISGGIAKKLFPDAHIEVKGFQDVSFDCGDDEQGAGFDLVITNVPFGTTKIYDAETDTSDSIHDYFVKKSLKLLRNYGELAVISSTYLMDKKIKSSLPVICKRAAFLGGVRLPSSSFKRLADTTVATDVLFFEKDVSGTVSSFNMAALQPVEDHKFPAANGRGSLDLAINEFFAYTYGTMRSRVLGAIRVKAFHGTSIEVQYDADEKSMLSDLSCLLESSWAVKPAQELTSNWGCKVSEKHEDFAIVGDDKSDSQQSMLSLDKTDGSRQKLEEAVRKMPTFEFSVFDGDVYYKDIKAVLKNASMNAIDLWYNDDGSFSDYGGASKETIAAYKRNEKKGKIISEIEAESPSTRGKHAGMWKSTAFFAMPYKTTELLRIKGMTAIKQAYRNLIDLQTNYRQKPTDKELKDAIARLNAAYDAFWSKFGRLNDQTNARLFRDDNSAILVQSLEEQKIMPDGTTCYVKGPAFEKPMIAQARKARQVQTAHDALILSLSENRGVDFEFMSAVNGGKSREELIEELGDEIVIDPLYYSETGQIRYVDRDTFLSGDILSKMDLVRTLISEIDDADEQPKQ